MIPLKAGVDRHEEDGVNIYLPETALNSSDMKEFLANARYEERAKLKSAERMFFEEMLSKADFIRTFQAVADQIDVSAGQAVLELGASHCWASVLVKSDVPGAVVVTSDLVPECVRHSVGYERALATSLDEKWAFSVRDIPFADAQFDRIFTFAAFHHFSDRGDYSRAVREIARVLKPGGKIIFLYEPLSPDFLYPIANRRVNRKRRCEGVDEDVLLLSKLRRIAAPLGLSLKATPFPIFRYRDSVVSTVYYYVLAKTGLAKMMVCSSNIVMEKGL